MGTILCRNHRSGAFVSSQDNNLLGQLRERLPLALVIAVRHIGLPKSQFHKEIIDQVKDWSKNEVKNNSVPNSVIEAVCWSLLQTDSPVVLDITETFPKSWWILLARLRNGCARSGVQYCTKNGDSEFIFNDRLRDRILEHAKQKHGQILIEKLKAILADARISDNERRGALAIAGFLEAKELANEIKLCWELANDKQKILPDAIWTAARCYKTRPEDLLDPLIACWASLPDGQNSLEPKSRVADLLRSGLREARNEFITYLIEQAEIHESLRWPITYLCSFIDSPNALEFVVREAAKIEKEGNFSPWATTLHDNWSSHRTNQKLSQNSLSHLKTLWENETDKKFVRRRAFLIWLLGFNEKDTEILRNIAKESPFYLDAIRKRTELGDKSVVPDLCKIILDKEKKYTSRWFEIAHHVWCKEIKTIAESYLKSFEENIPKDFSGGQLDANYHLSHFLMMIPRHDAEMLLEKYWSHLGYSGLFVQTALYVGTPKCMELTRSSISKCPKEIPIFQHLGINFGYKVVGRYEFLTADHIVSLQPYLDRIDDFTLRTLAEACQQFGIVEWSEEYLAPLLSNQWRKRYHPTDEELLLELDEIAADRHSTLRITRWIEQFENRYELNDRTLNIIERWFSSNLTIRGLEVTAAFIERIGSRKDLLILDKYKVEASDEENAKIKESTRFAVFRRSLT